MEAKYLPYKIGSFCTHDPSKSKNNYVDLRCTQKEDVVHRVCQFGRFCNKCAAIITKAGSSEEECLCCEEKLEQYLENKQLCQHSDQTHDEITIKCLDSADEFHDVPLESKVCDQCLAKIRAAFMFSQECIVCAEKEKEIFDNLEKTLTIPAFHFYENLIEMCVQKKVPDPDVKK